MIILPKLLLLFVSRLTLQDSAGGKSPLLTTLPRKPKAGSRSPVASPIPVCHSVSSSSPKVGYGRTRNVSFVNPSPLMKIVLDGIASKVCVKPISVYFCS